jgi:hypothetical protein
MSRFQSTPDSVYASNPGFIDAGVLQATISGNVNAGELVTLHESGIIRRTDPHMTFDFHNNDDPQPVFLNQIGPLLSIPFDSTCTLAFALGWPIMMLSGQIIVPCHPRGTYGHGVACFSSSGVFQNYMKLGTDTCTHPPIGVPLKNGNYIHVWATSATLKFQVSVVNPGTPANAWMSQLAPATTTNGSIISLTTGLITSGNMPWFSVTPLLNGDALVTWAGTTGLFGQVIDGDVTNGALIGALITIDSWGNGGHHHSAACANGDVIVTAFDPAATRFKCYRISQSGSIVWTVQIPSAGTGYFSQPTPGFMHPSHNRIFEMENGNFVWALPDTDTYCKAFVCSSVGALLTTCDVGQQYHDAGVAFPMSKIPNGFGCAHHLNSQPNTYGSFFDSDGNSLALAQLMDSDSTTPPVSGGTPVVNCYSYWNGVAMQVNRALAFAGKGEFKSVWVDNDGKCLANDLMDVLIRKAMIEQPTMTRTNAAKLALTEIQQGTVWNATPANQLANKFGNVPSPMPLASFLGLSFSPIVMGAPFITSFPDGRCFSVYFSLSSLQLVFVMHRVGRSSILGVSQSAAVDGGAITVLATGAFVLPSTQYFRIGGAFDRRQATPPGCRGVVGGANATLFGWQ